MQFLAYYETAPGKPFLFVSATNKAVASCVKHGQGNLLLLPWFIPNSTDPIYRQQCLRFVSAFTQLNEHLAPHKQTVSFPGWSTHYGWERERKMRVNLTSLQEQADIIAIQLQTKASELECENSLKVLFTAKGDILVDAVITVLRELGAKADPGEPGRDDVVVEFEGKYAVVEVKGKKGSAAESDAAQLEKWVAGSKEEKGKDAKGILFVNAYNETPLADRTEPVFPQQMLKYSTQREHCLMSTIQLLGLLLEARAHPDRRMDLVNSLFSTVGVCQQFADWRGFLIADTPAPSKTD